MSASTPLADQRARGPIRKQGQITNPELRRRMRQLALFVGILISGGLTIIPREPLLALVLVLCFLLTSPVRLFRPEFVMIWLLLLTTAAMVLIGGESFQPLPMAIRYANFFAGLALLSAYIDESRSTLADDLYPILKLMAFQAVLTPIAYILFSGFFWSFTVDDAVYETLFFIFTFHEFVDTGALLKRPDGFFFEPGVFQIYLNTFLFIALFVRKLSKFDVALGILAVLATQSTTGVTILMLQLCVAYWLWLRSANRMQKVGVLVFVPLLLAPLASYSIYNISQKFYGQFSGSAEAREYDLRTGIAVALEHPITGIGFDYERYFEKSMEVGYREAELSRDNITERGNTNGIVVLLYSIGIPLALIFLWGMIRQRLFRPGALYAALALLSLTSESLSLTPFFLLIAFSGLLIQPKRVKGVAPRARAVNA